MNQDSKRVIEVLDVLYGDGAYEISKALTDRQKRGLTAGLSAVGATAGAAGLGYAGLKTGQAYRAARFGVKPTGVKEGLEGAKKLVRGKRVKAAPTPTKAKKQPLTTRWEAAKTAVKHEKVGAALIPLEVAGLGGEIMATKILHGDTKHGKPEAPKRKLVKKSETDIKVVKYKLMKKGVNVAGTGAKAAPKVGKQVLGAAADLGQMSVETVKKDVDFEIRGEVSKMNVDLKQVFGWASVIEMNGQPVIDLQDDIMTIETIEKAAYDYVHKSRKGGRQHQRDGDQPMHVSDMIESFVLTPEKKEQMGLPNTTPTGWWVGFQINDDDTWAAYKDGKLKEFSIHGSGVRKTVDA